MDWIKSRLKKTGRITRNQCLRRYISRLGARINDLKKEGWGFRGYYKKTRNGMDYVYEMIR